MADTMIEQTEDQGQAEITQVVGGDVNRDMINALKAAGDMAGEYLTALRRVLVQATYPSDWNIQGVGDKAKACLASHGAERIAVMIGGFTIEESAPAEKSTFTDAHGEGYLWRYFYKVSWRGRECGAIGMHSTRDKFLGKAHGEFKSIADINEADIQRAARHVAIGEGIKQLLGLRNLPASEMPNFGMGTPDKPIQHVERDSQDGEERKKRKSITDMLLELNDGDQDAAKAHLTEITSFEGKNEPVKGVTSTKVLKKKWLNTTLSKVTELHNKRFGGEENADQTQEGGGG